MNKKKKKIKKYLNTDVLIPLIGMVVGFPLWAFATHTGWAAIPIAIFFGLTGFNLGFTINTIMTKGQLKFEEARNKKLEKQLDRQSNLTKLRIQLKDEEEKAGPLH